MKSLRYKLPLFVYSMVGAVLIFFSVVHAYKTKVIIVELDNRIDVNKVIYEIESITNGRFVSVLHNPWSFLHPDKIDQIKLMMMSMESKDDNVTAYAIGHIWMTETKEHKMIIISLLDDDNILVDRLYSEYN